MKRHKLSNRYSKKMFSRNATRVHPLNHGLTGPGGPMRGGIRL